VIKMFFRKRFMDWEAYMARVEFLEHLNFQQNVRIENIKNL